jgi:hypothetical protein
VCICVHLWLIFLLNCSLSESVGASSVAKLSSPHLKITRFVFAALSIRRRRCYKFGRADPLGREIAWHRRRGSGGGLFAAHGQAQAAPAVARTDDDS